MPGLLRLLGIDEENVKWQDLAACRGMVVSKGEPVEHDPFFDDYEADPIYAKQVDEICLGCPVQALCLKAGKAGKEDGLWGGIYLSNGQPDKNRNKHKTPDVWERIAERVGV